MPSASIPEGRVAACLLQEWGIDPALPHGLPHSYSCGLPFLRPQSGARQLVRLLLFGPPHFLFLSGHPTTYCSDGYLSTWCFDWA